MHLYYPIPVFLLCLGMVLLGPGQAGAKEGADKTLSPYFLVKSDDPETDRLPLKSTRARVDIAGVIADVTVTQVYENQGKNALEAIYVFPASTRAAVYGMKMTIGERTIVAKIKERQKARQEYEAAKEAGKSASLLEQQRPNVFQMNVANILPGDTIKVELKYTELLVPEDGIYAFVYPTVVGPRYSETPAKGAPDTEKWVENPYLHEGEAPPYTFDLSATVSAGMPIQKLSCPSHEIDIDFQNQSLAKLALKPSEKSGGNRDFILRYALQGGQIQTGLLLYEGEAENFFLLMMQPPKRVEPETIPPREYVFIVDVSGSMNGFPLDTAKTLLKNLLGKLRPTDRFNVLLFAGSAYLMAEQSMAATPKNIKKAVQVIDRQRGGGGTRLLPALNQALNLPGAENHARSFVIATDGYVSVEKEAFERIRTHLDQANFFPFGIGSSVNRFLIEGMARAGMGEPFVITKPAEAAAQAEKFREYIQTPLLTHAGLEFDGFDAYDVEPPTVPDVLAQRPVIVFGKWKGEAKGTIRLSGLTGEGEYARTLQASQAELSPSHRALPYLWARHRIALLSDYNQVRKDSETEAEITRLGLKYNLLTAYTSFVAVDSRVRRQGEDLTTVNQPLPLPQGVSDLAVGQAHQGGRALKSRARGYAGAAKGIAREAAPAPVPAAPAEEREIAKEKDQDQADKDKVEVKKLPKAEITILQAKSKFSDNMDKDAVLKQIQKVYLRVFELCYQQALQKAPDLAGTLRLTVRIDGSGKVTQVKYDASDMKDPALQSCITSFVKRSSFPPSTDGKPGEFTLAMAFKTK